MKYQHKQWRKLYTLEQGSFARLPLFTRAIAAMLLKLCDENGYIEVGTGENPVDLLTATVAFRMGATKSDRRLMKLNFPLLFTEGYISYKDGNVIIKNFKSAQTVNERATTNHVTTGNHSTQVAENTKIASNDQKTPKVNGESTNEQRSVNDPSTVSQRSVNVTETSCNLSSLNNSTLNASIVENSIDKNREEINTILPTSSTDQVISPPTTGVAVATPTVHLGQDTLEADVILHTLRTTSNGKFKLFATATLMQQFQRVCNECSPKLTLEDFELLGKAHANGEAWPGLKMTPDLSFLLKDNGAMLLSGLQHAQEYKEKLEQAAKDEIKYQEEQAMHERMIALDRARYNKTKPELVS